MVFEIAFDREEDGRWIAGKIEVDRSIPDQVRFAVA